MAITIADNQGNAIDQNNPLPVDLTTSEAIIPTDIQSHLQSTIQTHNAVSVGISGQSANTNWIDCDGFISIGTTMTIDVSNSNTVSLFAQWSNDGSNVQGQEQIAIPSSSWTSKAGIVDTKARYFKLLIVNNDTVAHTVSAWAYLKA